MWTLDAVFVPCAKPQASLASISDLFPRKWSSRKIASAEYYCKGSSGKGDDMLLTRHGNYLTSPIRTIPNIPGQGYWPRRSGILWHRRHVKSIPFTNTKYTHHGRKYTLQTRRLRVITFLSRDRRFGRIDDMWNLISVLRHILVRLDMLNVYVDLDLIMVN